MALHYQIAGNYKPDMHLIGLNTIKLCIELYGGGNLPYWVIIDTKWKLKGLLHICRRFELCKDLIILLSEKTPEEYFEYLKERNYDYHIIGKDHVDLKKALEFLTEKYDARTVLTDTGSILGNLLLNQGLAREICVLVHPTIVGNKGYNMFTDVDKSISLKLYKRKILDNGYVWLVYGIEN